MASRVWAQKDPSRETGRLKAPSQAASRDRRLDDETINSYRAAALGEPAGLREARLRVIEMSGRLAHVWPKLSVSARDQARCGVPQRVIDEAGVPGLNRREAGSRSTRIMRERPRQELISDGTTLPGRRSSRYSRTSCRASPPPAGRLLMPLVSQMLGCCTSAVAVSLEAGTGELAFAKSSLRESRCPSAIRCQSRLAGSELSDCSPACLRG